jgi:hypothetical protein
MGRDIGMGKIKQIHATPDSGHNSYNENNDKVFLPTLQPNMFSDTFVQLSPILMAQLHCFVLHMLQRKA